MPLTYDISGSGTNTELAVSDPEVDHNLTKVDSGDDTDELAKYIASASQVSASAHQWQQTNCEQGTNKWGRGIGSSLKWDGV